MDTIWSPGCGVAPELTSRDVSCLALFVATLYKLENMMYNLSGGEIDGRTFKAATGTIEGEEEKIIGQVLQVDGGQLRQGGEGTRPFGTFPQVFRKEVPPATKAIPTYLCAKFF